MKAMILAAGRGTRLGEQGLKTPKCLMVAGGKTLLEHAIERLKSAGVSSVVINLHHLRDQVREFVHSHNSFGIEVQFSEEAELLDTGGSVLHARALLKGSEHVFVHNADIYADIDLLALVARAKLDNSIATLAVMDRPSNRKLLFDPERRLVGWMLPPRNPGESPIQEIISASTTGKWLAFSGVQIVREDFFRYLGMQEGAFSIITSYLAAARAGELVTSWSMDGELWADIGTPDNLLKLQNRLAVLKK